jgi:Spy/CpxP family protein refolding chaperone
MKINLLAAGALVAALALPLGAAAQQGQPPSQASQGRATPSVGRMQHQWARRFGNLNLSSDQQQRVQSLINQYSQSHPEGSPVDREAKRELRRQLMGVLSDDQRQQLRQQMHARRAQMQGGGQDQAQYQQGAPDQRYQQGPPDDQGQQGPPDQRYQQGPPDDQGPPGPPDQNQPGPPDQNQPGPPQQ